MTWILLALVLCSLVLAARLERPGIITLVAIVLLAVHMIRVLHRGDWFADAVSGSCCYKCRPCFWRRVKMPIARMSFAIPVGGHKCGSCNKPSEVEIVASN